MFENFTYSNLLEKDSQAHKYSLTLPRGFINPSVSIYIRKLQKFSRKKSIVKVKFHLYPRKKFDFLKTFNFGKVNVVVKVKFH